MKMRTFTKKKQFLGVIRLLRPQFILTHIIAGFGGLAVGLAYGFELTKDSLGLYAFVPIIIIGIGVHLRDEVADWTAGYDAEHGGMGIFREGLFHVKTVRAWGFLLSGIGIVIGLLQTIGTSVMLIVAIPACIVVIFANYLTEEIPYGHELIIGSVFWGVFMWMYLAQKWPLTLSIILFSLFIYILFVAMIPYQDIGDYEADLKSGKKTLTVELRIDGVGHLGIFVALFSLVVLYFALITSPI